ncbi:hypothetical protein [Streptomyces canus]|uniref:hypothetical protein n=1 Tax=Streptomyces canus TaxID=58343 RepID=UPI003251854A
MPLLTRVPDTAPTDSQPAATTTRTGEVGVRRFTEAFGDALVSCAGSLTIVDLPMPGAQLELGQDEPNPIPEPEDAPDQALGTVALF